MQVVILASGRGARLAPITDTQPKPLLPAANCALLSYLLHTVADAGYTKILITIGYLASQVETFLSNVTSSLQITPVHAPDWSQGPLKSLKAALPHLNHDESILLLPSDLYITARNLQRLDKDSIEDSAILYDPHKPRFGPALKLDKDNLALKLFPSTTSNPSALPILPALRFSSKLIKMLQNLQNTSKTVFELLQHWVANENRLWGIPIEPEAWIDVDTPSDLIALNHQLLTSDWPPTPLPHGTYIPSEVILDGPVRSKTLTLGKETRIIGPVLLGPRVHIGDNCLISESTCLGAVTTVHNNSTLRKSLTLPHTHVPTNADLKNAILDAQGNIAH